MIPAEQQLSAPVHPRIVGLAGAVWGIAGVAGVLIYAIARLAGHVVSAIALSPPPLVWLLLVANVAFMTWAEGVRGFQHKFSPRVADRAAALAQDPNWLTVVLAPFYCAGFFAAPPRLLRVTWIGAVLIVLAVLVVQRLPQPWRGVLDAGVVAGLTWGAVTVLWFGWRALRGAAPR